MDTRCKSCGAPLDYDVVTCDVICHYCGFRAKYLDNENKVKDNRKECIYCGGKFIEQNPLFVTLKCEYCGQKTMYDKRIAEFKKFFILPYKFTKEMARNHLLKNIPIYRNRRFIKDLLNDKVDSIYIPFHAYSGEISGDFYWYCEEEVEEEDGTDSEGKTVYKTVTKSWYETTYADEEFKNTPVDASTIRLDSFDLSKRNEKRLTFNSTNLDIVDEKYFLLSKYLYFEDRNFTDTFHDFKEYASNILINQSRPAHGEELINYNLYYDYNKFKKDKINVLIPFYYFDSENSKYYCWLNASNGKVRYKAPISVAFVLTMVLLGIIVIVLTVFVIVFLNR